MLKNFFLETWVWRGKKEKCQHKETLKAPNILAGRNLDAKKKNDTDGGTAQLGREISHEKEGKYGQGRVGKLQRPGPLALRPMGPTGDLLFVVFPPLTFLSQTWPTVPPSHPPLRDQGKNLHFIYQLTTFCIAISGKVLSLYIFSFLSVIFLVSKVLTKGTIFKIKLNPEWTIVMNCQRMSEICVAAE